MLQLMLLLRKYLTYASMYLYLLFCLKAITIYPFGTFGDST